MSAKTYLLRQGILEAMKFYGSDMASNISDIALHPQVQLLRVAEDAISEQLEELAGMGYVERCPGFGGGYFKITTLGLQQVSPEFPTDPFISGRPA